MKGSLIWLLAWLCRPASAFTSVSRTLTNLSSERNLNTPIQLYSSVPNKDEDENKLTLLPLRQLKNWRDLLPPLPEDHLVLTGDVAALFVYCFLDHTFADLLSEETTLRSVSTSTQLPVWADVSSFAGSSLLKAILTTQQMADIGMKITPEQMLPPQYAPCLQSAGVSFVIMSSCWLFSGYLLRSFSLNNTIYCSPHNAVKITFKTWCATALLVTALTAYSVSCGCPFMAESSTFGLTKSDVNFIFDSLGVLAVWRFIVAYMLNSRW